MNQERHDVFTRLKIFGNVDRTELIGIENHSDRMTNLLSIDKDFESFARGEVKKSGKILVVKVALRTIENENATISFILITGVRFATVGRANPARFGHIDVGARFFALSDPLPLPVFRLNDSLNPRRRSGPIGRLILFVPNARLPVISSQALERGAGIRNEIRLFGLNLSSIPKIAFVVRKLLETRRHEKLVSRLFLIVRSRRLRNPGKARGRRINSHWIRKRFNAFRYRYRLLRRVLRKCAGA